MGRGRNTNLQNTELISGTNRGGLHTSTCIFSCRMYCVNGVNNPSAQGSDVTVDLDQIGSTPRQFDMCLFNVLAYNVTLDLVGSACTLITD